MTDLFISSVGTCLPTQQPIESAIQEDLISATLASSIGVQAAAVSDTHPAHLAARATEQALRRIALDATDIALVLYASLFDQVHGLWAPASYLQRVALGNDCLAMEIGQVSNGAMTGIEIAQAYLAADPGRHSALIATGDRLTMPRFNRWSSDPGTVYADGGTAAVLSSREGFARVLTITSVSDAQLEGMHRMGEAFGEVPASAPETIDLSECKDNYVAEAGPLATARIAEGQHRVIQQALDQTGLKIDDFQHFCLPHMGWRRLRAGFFTPFGIDPEKTTWCWSKSIGHLGPGDPVASLDHLAGTGQLRQGDLCLVASVGAGFTWSVMILEICSSDTSQFQLKATT